MVYFFFIHANFIQFLCNVVLKTHPVVCVIVAFVVLNQDPEVVDMKAVGESGGCNGKDGETLWRHHKGIS